MARRHMPGARDMSFAAARFGNHFVAHQQAELNADAGKADTVAANFAARRDVMVARQFAPLHAGAVVDGR